jgi:hypothetical protein
MLKAAKAQPALIIGRDESVVNGALARLGLATGGEFENRIRAVRPTQSYLRFRRR